MPRLLILIVAVLSFTPQVLFGQSEKTPARKLVVLLVFDQLRGDYIERWKSLYGKGGFERFTRDGVWFSNCHYDYAHTVTGAGHASLVTGCSPSTHGIMGNDWYDRQLGRQIAAVENERFTLVPPLSPVDPPDPDAKKEAAGTWPGRRLAATVGDVLHARTGGKGKVIALALKDRAAIFLASLLAFACYWFDSASGGFVTSSYYRETPHAWVAEFNKEKLADQWFGKGWTRLGDFDYEKHSGPDDAIWETEGFKQGRTFPHEMKGGGTKVNGMYYDAVTCSPYGNELLVMLAKRAIEAEKLGEDDAPDLLCLSFSSNDLVGHVWGPDSQEVLDITLRTDRLLKEFFEYLDGKVGKENYAVVLSSDHGICPIPQAALAQGKAAGRINPGKLAAGAKLHLNRQFASADADLPWIEWMAASTVYLNQSLIADRRLAAADVERSLAGWLETQEGVQKAYTRSDLIDPASRDPLQRMVRKSYYPGRSGEVFIVNRPYWLLSSRPGGTTHGTPHEYDTHVPLLVSGAGVGRLVSDERVSPLATAAILSRLLGIEPPSTVDTPLPAMLRKAIR